MRRVDRPEEQSRRLRYNHEDELRAIRGTLRGGAWEYPCTVTTLRLMGMFRSRLRAAGVRLRTWTDPDRNVVRAYAEEPPWHPRTRRVHAALGAHRAKAVRMAHATRR